MKSPAHYSPISDTARAERRATVVLDEMVKTHAITPAQRDNAFAQPVKVSRTLANQHAQYFVDWVDSEVRSILGRSKDDVLQQDLVVETTVDLPIQTDAERAVQTIASADAKAKGVQQAALVALDGEGRVRAFVGGADYNDSQFDRGRRRPPPGRLVVEALRLSHRHGERPHPRHPGGRWSRSRSAIGSRTTSPAATSARSLCRQRSPSRSTPWPPAWANEVGTQNVARTARRLGVTSPIQTEPSMALGAVEVSPVEMAQAYAAFSNGGYGVKAYGIERIRTAAGKVLYDHGVAKPTGPG